MQLLINPPTLRTMLKVKKSRKINYCFKCNQRTMNNYHVPPVKKDKSFTIYSTFISSN